MIKRILFILMKEMLRCCRHLGSKANMGLVYSIETLTSMCTILAEWNYQQGNLVNKHQDLMLSIKMGYIARYDS